MSILPDGQDKLKQMHTSSIFSFSLYPLTFQPPPAKMKETQSGSSTGHAGE